MINDVSRLPARLRALCDFRIVVRCVWSFTFDSIICYKSSVLTHYGVQICRIISMGLINYKMAPSSLAATVRESWLVSALALR